MGLRYSIVFTIIECSIALKDAAEESDRAHSSRIVLHCLEGWCSRGYGIHRLLFLSVKCDLCSLDPRSDSNPRNASYQ